MAYVVGDVRAEKATCCPSGEIARPPARSSGVVTAKRVCLVLSGARRYDIAIVARATPIAKLAAIHSHRLSCDFSGVAATCNPSPDAVVADSASSAKARSVAD